MFSWSLLCLAVECSCVQMIIDWFSCTWIGLSNVKTEQWFLAFTNYCVYSKYLKIWKFRLWSTVVNISHKSLVSKEGSAGQTFPCMCQNSCLPHKWKNCHQVTFIGLWGCLCSGYQGWLLYQASSLITQNMKYRGFFKAESKQNWVKFFPLKVDWKCVPECLPPFENPT